MFFVIDWDGTRKGFRKTVRKLRKAGISYVAAPSPSHWAKKGYRMRILVPVSGKFGSTKEAYTAQYMAFLSDVGLPIPDKTASDTKRLFYPTIMDGIRQVPSKEPKPIGQSRSEALKLIEWFYGIKYKLRGIQEAMEIAHKVLPKQYHQTKSGWWERSQREEVCLPGNMVITHNGSPIETFDYFIAHPHDHYRCDCPFDGEHASSSKHDCAFIQGNKIICASNTHGHLVGRREDSLLGDLL